MGTLFLLNTNHCTASSYCFVVVVVVVAVGLASLLDHLLHCVGFVTIDTTDVSFEYLRFFAFNSGYPASFFLRFFVWLRLWLYVDHLCEQSAYQLSQTNQKSLTFDRRSVPGRHATIPHPESQKGKRKNWKGTQDHKSAKTERRPQPKPKPKPKTRNPEAKRPEGNRLATQNQT